MLKHVVFLSIFLSRLVVAASPEAFVGTWVFDPAGSKNHTITITRAGDLYSFSYTAGETERVLADGNFHKSANDEQGQISFQKTGAEEWTMKFKSSQFQSLSTEIMTVAPGGQSMTSSVESVPSSGQTSKSEVLYSRTKPGEGIEGEWTFTKRISREGPRTKLIIKSDGSNQMTFTMTGSKNITNFKTLDGKPYKDEGPTASLHETSSVELLDDHSLMMKWYKDGKLLITGKWTVSDDGRTLTNVVFPKDKPQSTTVFNKQ